MKDGASGAVLERQVALVNVREPSELREVQEASPRMPVRVDPSQRASRDKQAGHGFRRHPSHSHQLLFSSCWQRQPVTSGL